MKTSNSSGNTGIARVSRRRLGQRSIGWALPGASTAAALVATGLVAFITTWFLLSPAVERVDRDLLRGLVFANTAIAAVFAALIGERLWRLWSNRRNELAGSRTHLRLVGQFAAVAVAPAVIAFLFAFTILRTSLNDVFGERIDNYQNTARDLANRLVEIKAAELETALSQIAFDIRRNEAAGVGLEATPISFRQYLDAQAQLRGLSALYVLDGRHRVIARIEKDERAYLLPPPAKLNDIAAAPAGETFVFGVNDEAAFDAFRGAVGLNDYGRGYLVAFLPMDPKLTEGLKSVRALKDDWENAKVGRSRLERVFAGGYVVLALIILFGAIWLALWAATRIVQPIRRLVEMAERVSSGELGARVEVYKKDGELGVLARAMNHMTAQLQTQRDDLIETNRQFDLRRRFTETVLAGVSAGVVGVSANGRVVIANRSAVDLLKQDRTRLSGSDFSDIFPEASDLFAAASHPPYAEQATVIEVERDGTARTLNVRIASDEVDGERSYVVTFDDITELIGAQRSAAWGDVARRIAHEIKNPLTPIQLSAERLRRKYLAEIKTNPEIFDKCTETIIRHVGDIGRMVDEFSSFARMPKPVVAREDLREILRSAVFPQRVAFPDIEFIVETPPDATWTICDGRLIAQALGNLLKNAGESIGARLASEPGATGRIKATLRVVGETARIDVVDNGVGLPKAERHRLTEPYMTTRAKGTGLGLAIVRKVIEDHEGTLEFDDTGELGSTGARVSVTLPLAGEERAAATAAE